MKIKRIFSLIFLLLFLFSALPGCTPSPPEPGHLCAHRCEICGACADLSCTDSECAGKCAGHRAPETESEAGTDTATETETDSEIPMEQSKVTIPLPDAEVPLYHGVSVFVEEAVLPLYLVKVNNAHTWSPDTPSRTDSGAGYFSLTGKTEITVKAEGLVDCVVRPLSAGIRVTAGDGYATFTLSSPGNYVVEPNGDPEQAFFLFVSEHGNPPAPKTTHVLRFEKGIHTGANNSAIRGDTVTLGSDTTVILEDGAVVRARFLANRATNITICGNGIIDGSVFERNASTGKVTVPLEFNDCEDITLCDFSVLDPAGWCVNWYFCRNSRIDNLKILSSRSNGDGISLQSCKNIRVENCFLRTWDDSLVVKNYPRWNDRNTEGATENIVFSCCTLWTDLAQSMEVGYETVGETMKEILFENITVLHNFHKPVMSIHNANNASVDGVTFRNITVEDASMGKGDAGANNQLCEISVSYNATWSDQHKVTALGSIRNITVENVTVLAGNLIIPVRVAGCRDLRSGFGATVHTVENVVFRNVWVMGKPFRKSDLSTNEYTDRIFLEPGDAPVPVPFPASLSGEALSRYTDHAKVELR